MLLRTFFGIDLDNDWFLLFLPVGLILFVVAINWHQCIPLEEAPSHFDYLPRAFLTTDLSDKTCVVIDHGEPIFLSFPPLEENRILFALVVAGLFLSTFLCHRAFIRVHQRPRKLTLWNLWAWIRKTRNR
ncbi:MAG: hypothetical protein HUJ27_03395 [Rhodobacteraceae bacterium]|nr:hypothetical protein [Paracoccaceae bacterium]